MNMYCNICDDYTEHKKVHVGDGEFHWQCTVCFNYTDKENSRLDAFTK